MEAVSFPQVIRLAHLVFLSLWGGLLLAEAAIEFLPVKRSALLRPGAEFHYYIDLFLELPLIFFVVATGAVNIFFVRFSFLLCVKIIVAVFAIGANLYCMKSVIERFQTIRAGAPDEVIIVGRRRIMLAAALGMPLAAIAAVIGFAIASLHVS